MPLQILIRIGVFGAFGILFGVVAVFSSTGEPEEPAAAATSINALLDFIHPNGITISVRIVDTITPDAREMAIP